MFFWARVAKMKTEQVKGHESRWFVARRRMRWLAALVLLLALPFAADWFVSPRHHAAASMQSIVNGDSGVGAHRDSPLASKGLLPSPVQEEPFREVAHPFRVMPGDIPWIEELKNSIAKNSVAEAMAAPIFPNGSTELDMPGPVPYMPGELENDYRFPEIQPPSPPNVPPPGTNLYSGGGTGPGTFLPSGPAGPLPYGAGPATAPVVAIPEPGSAALLLAGLLALSIVQKCKPKDAPENVT